MTERVRVVRRSVLVVEDDEAIQATLRDLLTDAGFVVIGRADKRGAHEAMADLGTPDLAVIDYQLPDGVGTELCPELRARAVPTLVLSAYPRSLGPAMDMQADAWIGKPFDTEDLLRAVRDLLALPSDGIVTRLGPPGVMPKALRLKTP